jgi:hypothetical protein
MPIKKLSPGEELFALHLRANGIEFEREFRFFQGRKWRSDFYIPMIHTLVEIEGGVWVFGRHSRGKGYSSDLEKINRATIMGYRYLRYTTTMVELGHAINEVLEVVESQRYGSK